MNTLLALLLLTCSVYGLSSQRTIVVYNSASTESKYIAQHYQQKRAIPEHNLIGLDLPMEGAISIADYDTKILAPLQKQLTKKHLWTRNTDGGVLSAEFDLIVTIYGVPYKTLSSMLPATKDAEGNPVPARPRSHQQADGASVDSELTLLCANGKYVREQALKNPFYRGKNTYDPTARPSTFYVGRIDGPSPEICIRMINDAITTESTGLYGMCYLDKAYKGDGYKVGDDWLDKIAQLNKDRGIPTVIEETKDVFLSNYPMMDAALYYGWYSHHFSGAFRNPEFKLKTGSIVTHLHSFSAVELRNPAKHWSGPILARGATATLGNVHEPFLHLTTNFDYFHQELLAGKTLVEAAWHATPCLSWHNVVLGDPLYNPFRNAIPEVKNNDPEYAHLARTAPLDTRTKFDQLINQAEQTESSRLFEIVGLTQSRLEAHEKCLSYFRRAEQLAKTDSDKMRNILHQIAYHRKHEQRDQALTIINAHRLSYQDNPVGIPLLSLKNILDPPPPPPVENPDATK